MHFTLERDPTCYGIHAYDRGEITITIPRTLDAQHPQAHADKVTPLQPPVRRETRHRSLVLMPQRLFDWPPQRFEDLTRAHFDILAEQDVELILFGSGARLRWPAHDLLVSLVERGIGIEVMDTGAACRTYNILMSDRRRFAAAFLMIES